MKCKENYIFCNINLRLIFLMTSLFNVLNTDLTRVDDTGFENLLCVIFVYAHCKRRI